MREGIHTNTKESCDTNQVLMKRYTNAAIHTQFTIDPVLDQLTDESVSSKASAPHTRVLYL